MADALWPTELTRDFRVDSLQETAPDLVIRTSMDVGPGKVRRRVATNTRTLQCAIDLTGTELAIFDAFFVTACAGGAVAFIKPNPRTEASTRYRFSGQPTYHPRGPRAGGAENWLATFTLEELGPTNITAVCPTVSVTDPEGVSQAFAVGSSLALTLVIANLARIGSDLGLSRGVGITPGGGSGAGIGPTDGWTFSDLRSATWVLPFLGTGSGYAKWRYPKSADDSAAAWVKFSTAQGWSYHVPESGSWIPAGGAGGAYDGSAYSGNEGSPPGANPYFRPFNHAPLVTGGTGDIDPALLCAGDSNGETTAAFFLAALGILDNACAAPPGARAQGFRMYLPWCVT